MSNVKNYTEQGGDKTVIGGTLEITAEGKLSFGGEEFSPNIIKGDKGDKGDKGEPGAAGVITPAETQAVSTATNTAELKSDFNDLLAKLKAAGFIAVDPTEGATIELAKVTDLVVTTVPFGTANTKSGVEAAILVLANAAIDSANYTVTILAGSTYNTGTNAWAGKFVVTNNTTPANTKTDAVNRAITVVIAAE